MSAPMCVRAYVRTCVYESMFSNDSCSGLG